MFDFKLYLNTSDGEQTNKRVKLNQIKLESGVIAAYIDAVSRKELDPEYGIQVDVFCNEKIKGYMADYRAGEYWCQPHFGTDFKDMPDETQFLIIERENGMFRVVVPVVNEKYKCVLKGGVDCDFSVRIFSWCPGLYGCKDLAFVYADGENPTQLAEICVKEALKILNNGTRPRDERRYPEIFEKLGWCSWDSMQIRVSEEGLIKKCEEFKEKEIPVQWAIIDDMWAEIRDFYDQEYVDFADMVDLMHSSALYHYEADPKRFPNGLSHCVKKIREYGIKVGMWHPTTGYWRGIDADGEAYTHLEKYLIKTENGYYVPDWHKENSYMYYKTFHDFFRKCGVDFVKIDNQSMTRRYYKNLAPVGRVAKEFHDGMEASVGEHFDNCMINCMGMGSEDMWNRTVSPISRCSGDFMPENREWFARHVRQCAYNSVFQGQFYWCDWDMWWTDDGQSAKNSVMRAISGGPIYVSDKLERSRLEVLNPLILSDGTILRCDRPCMPTKDCMTIDPRKEEKALKLQNVAGEHGIMAVININDENKPVEAIIGDSLIDGFDSKEYAVYEYFSREFKVLKQGESFKTVLENNDEFKLYIFAPIKDGFAVIGRTDKFISPKTIKYIHNEKIVLEEDGPYAYIKDGDIIHVED